MSNNKMCTTAGYEAMQKARDDARKGICCDHTGNFTGSGRNSIREGELGEYHESLRQETVTAHTLTQVNTFLLDHRPATPPKNFDRTQVGVKVTISYSDEHGVEQTRHFGLGGEGEPELYKSKEIAMIYYGTPFGRQLVNKFVGDQVEYIHGSQTYDATIQSIEPLPEPDGAPHLSVAA